MQELIRTAWLVHVLTGSCELLTAEYLVSAVDC